MGARCSVVSRARLVITAVVEGRTQALLAWAYGGVQGAGSANWWPGTGRRAGGLRASIAAPAHQPHRDRRDHRLTDPQAAERLATAGLDAGLGGATPAGPA